MRRSSFATLTCAAVMSAASMSGCGTDADKADEPDAADTSGATEGADEAADVGTCKADASPLARPYGEGFPDTWRFPPRTTVFDYEDRGESGRIVTGVSSAKFQTILDFLNHDAVDAGFTIESGETEEHDAEAEWEGNGYRGRWAIRESAQCPGETVIQVLAGPE